MSKRAPRQDDFQLHGGKPQQWCLRRAQTYTINKPTTQDLLLCAGSMAYAASTLTGQEAGVTLALERSFAQPSNRHVMDTYGIGRSCGLLSGGPCQLLFAFWMPTVSRVVVRFAYDDVNNQSSYHCRAVRSTWLWHKLLSHEARCVVSMIP